MRRSGVGSGGGYGSNKHVQVSVKTGQRAQQYHQSGVSQFGEAVGDHITHRGQGTGYRGDPVRGAYRSPGAPGSVPLGNQIATNVGAGGPGKGRTVYGCGSQDMHGSANPGNPPNKSTDILNQFGPNYKAPRS
jgi:hypothetical protein